MKLYFDHPAPNPRIVRIFIAEKGIELDEERVRIRKREHQQRPFLDISPFGELPVLECRDGRYLTEVPAICRYLEMIAANPPLLGSNPEDAAYVEMWRRRVELKLFLTSAMCYRHQAEAMAELEEQILEWSALNGRRALQAHRYFNDRLASSPYIAGDAFTIADIYGVCALDFGKYADLKIDPELTHLQHWYEKIAARPSVLKC